MKRIFISYSREDVDKARTLATRLAADGHAVWWDHALAAGSVFPEEIRKQIALADLVIVLWSRRSAASAWVLDEANLGRQTNKLLPVRIDACDIPIGFGSLHTIDAMRWPQDAEVVAAAASGRQAAAPRKRRSAGPWIAASLGLLVLLGGAAGAYVYVYGLPLPGSATDDAFVQKAVDFSGPLPAPAITVLGVCPPDGQFAAGRTRHQIGVWSFACMSYGDGEVSQVHFWTDEARRAVSIAPDSNGWWEMTRNGRVTTVYTSNEESNAELQSDTPASLRSSLANLLPWNQTLASASAAPAPPHAIRIEGQDEEDGEIRGTTFSFLSDMIVIELSDGARLFLGRDHDGVVYEDTQGVASF